MAKRLLGIVVLGCPAIHKGGLSPVFEQRVLSTKRVYDEKKTQKPLIICTGYHIRGSPDSQAAALKKSLIKLGVPETDILIEDESRSTLENAVKTKPILDHHGLREITVVTNQFHNDRAKYIFDHICHPDAYKVTMTKAENGISGPALHELTMLENRKMVNLRPKIIESTLNS